MTQHKKRFQALSLFSGGMGFDIGLFQTGRFEIKACVEKVPAFCETIRRNRDSGRIDPQIKVYEGDIKKLDPRQVMADLQIEKGDIDIVVGGPPCQSFSTAGRRGTVQDPRGTLLWEFLRFIDSMRPKMFLMENVRGLMSAAVRHRPISERPDKGGPPLAPDEQPGSVVRLFLGDLHDQYRMDCFEVNAVNYGVPQMRERVIFIGNRYNRIVNFPKPTHANPQPDNSEWFTSEEERMKPFSTLGEALNGLNERNPVILDFSPRKKSYLLMIPQGGNWRSLPDEVARESMGRAYYAKGGRSGWWRRLSFDLPSPAIMTLPNHASTALCHPTEVRALTLRECARIQEFPDDWELVGSPSEQYAQVGNAVPIRLARICGETLAEELDSIGTSDMVVQPGDNPICRVVYMKSHIRTRHWYKNGKAFVWKDGAANGSARYGSQKTDIAVRTIKKRGRSYASNEG